MMFEKALTKKWEFKNLSAPSDETMFSVAKLSILDNIK